jgi:hypothetical protein
MKFAFLSLTLLGLFMTSCEREGSGKCTETNISTVSRSSHNRGEDCSACHTSGGEGRGCFTVAGSAFKKDKSTPIQNAVVMLFSRDENWNIIHPETAIKLACDKSGNFYTTETVSFAGKYPALISNGDTTFMGGALTNNASCNSCHKTGGMQDPVYSVK